MAGLSALVQRLERFAAGEVKARIASKIRDVMHEQCIRGFREQRDPYGAPWAPRKGGGTWPLLDKTGDAINGLVARSTSTGVTLRIVNFMKFHQTGTRYMDARKPFPDPDRGLGTWSEPVHRAAVEAVQELMR